MMTAFLGVKVKFLKAPQFIAFFSETSQLIQTCLFTWLRSSFIPLLGSVVILWSHPLFVVLQLGLSWAWSSGLHQVKGNLHWIQSSFFYFPIMTFVDKGPSTPWFAVLVPEMGRNPLSANSVYYDRTYVMWIMLMHHYALHSFNGLHFYYFDSSFSMSYVSLLWNNLYIFFTFCQCWVILDTSTVFQPLGV